MPIKPKSKFHENQRFIVAAANKLGDTGVILVGTRHWDPIMHAQYEYLKDLPKFSSLKHKDIEQGFIDSKRNFLTREEAYALVEETGQPVVGEDWGELYSENLY